MIMKNKKIFKIFLTRNIKFNLWFIRWLSLDRGLPSVNCEAIGELTMISTVEIWWERRRNVERKMVKADET